MPIPVNHHCSVVVIRSNVNGDNRFLFSKYTPGYPAEVFVGAANPIGGNHESVDRSPWGILEREVTEEVAVKQGEEQNFAPENLILNLRREILQNAKPWGDFLVKDPPYARDRPAVDALVSMYESNIPSDLLWEVAKVIPKGKRIVTEGVACICTPEDLVTGKIRLANVAPAILTPYFGVALPNPHMAVAFSLRTPIRDTLAQYLVDFDYKKKVEP